jgi:hypothetical protein
MMIQLFRHTTPCHRGAVARRFEETCSLRNVRNHSFQRQRHIAQEMKLLKSSYVVIMSNCVVSEEGNATACVAVDWFQVTHCIVNVVSVLQYVEFINPLNAELNLVCHLLALAGVHHFVHVRRIRG